MNLDQHLQNFKEYIYSLGWRYIEKGNIPSKRTLRLIKKWNKPLFEEIINWYMFRRSVSDTMDIYRKIPSQK